VKTLSTLHQRQFVHELSRILKPGGRFGLVEVSVPESRLLRIPYMFYLEVLVPVVGKLLLGNPDNYRMLGVYTACFSNCRKLERLFAASGFDVRYQRFFGGCASGVVGIKL
jgi:demethylmenaquinone methyltransferase/2-methoxy-6-polyprenyl-1,4-benzoquinol methylase